MTKNRISLGRMVVMFSFYFTFIINVSANILVINKLSNIITTTVCTQKKFQKVFGECFLSRIMRILKANLSNPNNLRNFCITFPLLSVERSSLIRSRETKENQWDPAKESSQNSYAICPVQHVLL